MKMKTLTAAAVTAVISVLAVAVAKRLPYLREIL